MPLKPRLRKRGFDRLVRALSVVYGIEADIDYINLGGGGTTSAASTGFGGTTLTSTRENGDGFLGTVRGRIGYAGFDRTLLYVTGGLAYGEIKSNETLTVAGGPFPGGVFANNFNTTRAGWTAGGSPRRR